MIGHGGLLRAFSFACQIRGSGHVYGVLCYPQVGYPQSNNRKGDSFIPPGRPKCQTLYRWLFKATTAYTSTCTDVGASFAALLSEGTRVRHWQSDRRL